MSLAGRYGILLVVSTCYLAWATTASAQGVEEALALEGTVRYEAAYRLSPPHEITKSKMVGFVAGKYTVSPHLRFRLATRAFYDAAYAITASYPDNVRRDQEAEIALRQALLDVSFGRFDAHLGLQQIVWGEAAGTFIADVVNPKDLREFVLPDFRDLRRPLGALDVTYFLAEGVVLEGVWTPHLLFNRLPEAGAEFAFFQPPPPPGVQVVTRSTQKPATTLAHSIGGLRLSWLTGGWDLAGFYFDAYDAFPTPFTQTTSAPGTQQAVVTIAPRYTRVHRLGLTVGKTIEPVVLRSEMVVTFDKFLRTRSRRDSDGVVRRHVLNYMLGLDFTLFHKVDVGLQFLQQLVPGANAQERDEQQRRGTVSTAFSVRLETGFFDNALTPQLFCTINTDRSDYRLSPKVLYRATGAITLALGADIFGGRRDTLYGQFDVRDRMYTEISYQF